MLRKSISVFLAFSVMVFLLSFSVFADSTEQPVLSILTTSPSRVFVPVVETEYFDEGTAPTVMNFNSAIINCNRITIDNAGPLGGLAVSYSWIMVPIVISYYNSSNGAYFTSNPYIPTISGAECTNLVGCYDAIFSCNVINCGASIVVHPYGTNVSSNQNIYRARFDTALLCTFSFIAETNSLGTTSSIQAKLPINFNPFHSSAYQNFPAYDCEWFCPSVKSFIVPTPFYNTVTHGLGQIHNDLGSIYGLFHNVSLGDWHWQSIDRTDPDNIVVTDNTGSWWEAVLGSIQAIADPVLQQVEYENKAEDVGAEDALDVAFDSVGSSFGSLGDLAGLGDLGSWDGDIFAADGEQSLFDWFSQNTKNSIDAVPAKKGNELDIIDFYHKKISDYNEEVNGDDSTSD